MTISLDKSASIAIGTYINKLVSDNLELILAKFKNHIIFI